MFESNSEFDGMPSHEHHICTAARAGQWVIYSCPECNYELRENWETGEISVKNASPHIRHSGSYISPYYEHAFKNQN